MTRLVPVTLLMAVLTASRVASADVASGTLQNSAQITFDRREIAVKQADGSIDWEEPSAGEEDLKKYFNLATCVCGKSTVGSTSKQDIGWFRYRVYETPASGLHVGVDFYAGTNCNDSTHRPPSATGVTCSEKLESVGDLDADLNVNGNNRIPFNLYRVLAPLGSDGNCPLADNPGSTIYALLDQKGGVNYDVSFDQPVGSLDGETNTTTVDTNPPPFPALTAFSAAGGDGAIRVSFPVATSRASDVAYYQALCAVDDTGERAHVAPTQDPRYVTSTALCGVANDQVKLQTITLPASETERAVAAPTDDFAALDKAFVCGESIGTSDSITLNNLENGVPYRVIVLSVDLHGNYAAGYLDHTVTPIPSKDFWEDLNDRGTDVEPGLCLLAETYGDDSSLTNTLRSFRDGTLGRSPAGRWLVRAYYATLGQVGGYVHGSLALRAVAGVVLAPLVALALLWYWLSLPGLLALIAIAYAMVRYRRALRRARTPRLAMNGATAALVLVLGLSRAHAGGYDPYWEDSEAVADANGELAEDADNVRWHVGIRVGPYTPDIDHQAGGPKERPYHQMFGGYRILPMLDIDRVVWDGFGQLGIGVSGGYVGNNAKAYVNDSKSTDKDRARASDSNSIHIVPLTLTATYRFTYLDDEYGIPVVPYVRGGLAYDLWWVRVANGNLARVCTEVTSDDGTMKTECGDKALGGSLGYTGSVGIAIRAERIDASAATSMRQSGIQHAGIYAELSASKIDGFGSDKKLSLGDRSWFAGVNFEF